MVNCRRIHPHSTASSSNPAIKPPLLRFPLWHPLRYWRLPTRSTDSIAQVRRIAIFVSFSIYHCFHTLTYFHQPPTLPKIVPVHLSLSPSPSLSVFCVCMSMCLPLSVCVSLYTL